MANVTLKWGGKAAKGSQILGTWWSTWENGMSTFYGKTSSGQKSSGMLKRELRLWFEAQQPLPPPPSEQEE